MRWELIKARRAAKLTQAQLADLVGLHQVSLSRIETGRKGVSPDTQRRLARALKVRRELLFGEAL